MTEIRAHSPLSPIDDDAAALYLGHLTVAAEAALRGYARETQIALTWLSAHVAAAGDRTWTAQIHDIEIAGSRIGDWRVTARLFPGHQEYIGLERRATLMADGREVVALAHPFLENRGKEEAVASMVDFSVMQLCADHAPKGSNLAITDLAGTVIRVSLRRKREFFKTLFHFNS